MIRGRNRGEFLFTHLFSDLRRRGVDKNGSGKMMIISSSSRWSFSVSAHILFACSRYVVRGRFALPADYCEPPAFFSHPNRNSQGIEGFSGSGGSGIPQRQWVASGDLPPPGASPVAGSGRPAASASHRMDGYLIPLPALGASGARPIAGLND